MTKQYHVVLQRIYIIDYKINQHLWLGLFHVLFHPLLISNEHD